MPTLTQFEASFQMLPREQRLKVWHIVAQAMWEARMANRPKIHDFPVKDTELEWPVPPPDVPLAELQRIEALIEKEFGRAK